MASKRVRILGIRGIPASHGGFETFAERLSLYLVKRGWDVIVYCQEKGHGDMQEDVWLGVKRVHIPSGDDTAKNTILFDWKATRHAARSPGVCLTLGYNTAIFTAMLRMAGHANLINMDGIEYHRAKWGPLAKVWFRINERAGCLLADRLIADHPEIKTHLSSKVSPAKITTIAYGADPVTNQSAVPVRAVGLVPGGYVSMIARPEPENSVLEIVEGFSAKARGLKLAVLGQYDETNSYHQAVKKAASPEVVFLGAIYDSMVVQALRFHSVAYIHGHQVGGSNPSLIEAMAAGNAVIADDNRFNRWVAGAEARYFRGASGIDSVLDDVLANSDLLDHMRQASKAKYVRDFQWESILSKYETVLHSYLPEQRNEVLDGRRTSGGDERGQEWFVVDKEDPL